MKKLLMTLLLAALPGLSMASPAKEEQTAWCTKLGNNAFTASGQRNIEEVPPEVFMDMFAAYYARLVQMAEHGVLTPAQVNDLLDSVEKGWSHVGDPAEVAQAVYDACMKRKDV